MSKQQRSSKPRPLRLPSTRPTWVMLLAVLGALRTMQLARFSMETVARRLKPRRRRQHLREFASLNYVLLEAELRDRHVVVDGGIPMPVLNAMLTAMKEEGGKHWTPNRVWGLLGSEDDREQRRFVNIVCRIVLRAHILAHQGAKRTALRGENNVQ